MIRRWLLRKLREWQQARELARFNEGWDWAAGELMRGKAPEDLEQQVACGAMFDDMPHPFDEGAMAAISMWVAYETQAAARLQDRVLIYGSCCGQVH